MKGRLISRVLAKRRVRLFRHGEPDKNQPKLSDETAPNTNKCSLWCFKVSRRSYGAKTRFTVDFEPLG